MTGTAASPDTPATRTAWFKQEARALGFDAAGVARATESPYAGEFREAVASGRMDPVPYLAQRVDERCDPRVLLPGAQSVVMVQMGYAEPRPPAPAEPHLMVARYAARRDYHNPMIKKLRALRSRMRARWPDADAYVSSDTGAVMERAWAERAGLGWIGKSSMLLSRTLGTYTLLGAFITTLDLEPDAPGTDHCGTCTACLDACPTGAIVAPRTVDARRCITAHTVETPGPTLREDAPPLHGWVFGCDVCQEVCPYAKRGVVNPALGGRPELAHLRLVDLLDNRASDSLPTLQASPLMRAGVHGLVRNAAASRGS
jgi:epoxyqueuosine reductase